MEYNLLSTRHFELLNMQQLQQKISIKTNVSIKFPYGSIRMIKIYLLIKKKNNLIKEGI